MCMRTVGPALEQALRNIAGTFQQIHIVLQIREETHKTAIEFHRKRREKRDFTSELSEIPGIGNKRKLTLLKEFGSIERIAKASAEEMKPFVGGKAANDIAEHFERQRAIPAKHRELTVDTNFDLG